MQRQLDAYCIHLRSERQVSPHTLEAYRRDLGKVVAFCSKEAIPTLSRYRIALTRKDEGNSLIQVLNANGQPETSVNAERILQLIANELR